MNQDLSFSFGRNWRNFLKSFDRERLRIAEASLREFLNLPDLKGRSFVDIGCGSGLFSYAAFNLGAERIVSFDVDPESVQCCKYLHDLAGKPSNWEIHEGSILDRGFVLGLGTFDLVYSWGVLHHTGKMWEAIDAAAGLVNPGGLYYIALYNKILARDGGAAWVHSFWLAVKRTYNSWPRLSVYLLEYPALAAYLAMVAAKGQNPFTHVKNYRSHRGMSWRTDATDWLGGYPYEFATVEEVFRFIKEKFPDFNLVNIKVTSGRGLNWFLFENTVKR
ncbi:MAG: class I SAM-dependent methyltransferase [Desulfomonile tiedjei]|nr:class I SAM-dependent methyltransferase [Desulfomonile tiedjei]